MSYNNNNNHTYTITTTNSNVNRDNRRKTLPLMSFDAYSSATVSINYLPQSRSSFPSAQQINYTTTPLIYFLDHPYCFKTSSSSPSPPPLDQNEVLDFDKVISSQGNKTGLEM